MNTFQAARKVKAMVEMLLIIDHELDTLMEEVKDDDPTYVYPDTYAASCYLTNLGEHLDFVSEQLAGSKVDELTDDAGVKGLVATVREWMNDQSEQDDEDVQGLDDLNGIEW